MIRRLSIFAMLFVAIIHSTVCIVFAGFEEGSAAYARGDYAQAFKEFKALADQGNSFGQVFLGDMCSGGRGVPQNYAEAARWYRKAAEQGDVYAQFNLAVLYSNGQGVQQDYAEAAQWFRKAADRGNTKAQLGLRLISLHEHELSRNELLARTGTGQGKNDASRAVSYCVAKVTSAFTGDHIASSALDDGR